MNGQTPNKVPLRNLANLFTHLGANTKAQIESAFSEAESQLNSHNNSVVDNQDRRSISGLVDSPTLTSTTNNRGFDVQWNRLNDKSISFYEIQISYDNIFSAPDTYKVVDTSFALEGIGTTVFARVRGVRFNGDCGLWSDTLQIDAFAQSGGPVVYSVGLNDVSHYYIADPGAAYPVPILEKVIDAQRQNGGIMVFGSFGLSGTNTNASDFVRITLNSQIAEDIDATNMGSTRPTSIGLGPVFLTHDQFYFSNNFSLNPGTEASSGSGSGSGTPSGWNFNGNGAVGTMETTVPITGTRVNCANYSVTNQPLGGSYNSKHLHLTNFGFSIPSTSTIIGIQLTITTAWGSSGINENKSYPTIHDLFLVDGGVDRPTSFVTANTTTWPRSLPYTLGAALAQTTFGGPTDLWNETAGFWTAAKVNASNFGFSISAHLRTSISDATADATLRGGGTTSQDVSLFGAEMTIYSENTLTGNRQVDIKLLYFNSLGSGSSTPSPGLQNACLNIVEFGDVL